jgi:hypothetical protein
MSVNKDNNKNSIFLKTTTINDQLNDNTQDVLKILDILSNIYVKITNQTNFFISNIEKYLSDLHNEHEIDIVKMNLTNLSNSYFISLQIILAETYNKTFIIRRSFKKKNHPGYWINLNKNNRIIKVLFVNSYRLKFCSNGIGKIIFFKKNNSSDTLFFGEKYSKAKSIEELEYRINNSLKYLKEFNNYLNKEYVTTVSSYNNIMMIIKSNE